jgi:hypothetical protein
MLKYCYGHKKPVLDQFELIHETEWDTLIILDALRYDLFKRVNRLKGKLRQCQSRASHTYPWLEETWPDKYDLTYFSAHVIIGDKVAPYSNWNAIHHFTKVVPIWEAKWNDSLGTVHPRSVCQVVRDTDYDRGVIHFLQPHGPWIGTPRLGTEWSLQQHDEHGLMADAVAYLEQPTNKFMVRAYKGNLRLVLNTLKKYRKVFKGKTIITADHGEMLGETDPETGERVYLHFLDNPEWAKEFVRKIPWFVWKR